MGRADAIFVSDVHLSATHPATISAFLSFVDAEVAGRTARFYILGDLFEYWVGDDDAEDAWTQEIVARLRMLADDDVEVAFIAGNRDFLIGEGFAQVAGLRVLPDPLRITIAGVDLLLSHGDALCTDDVDYQAFRSLVRASAWQRTFLDQPLAARREAVSGARTKSEEAKREKDISIMDANERAICELLALYPGAILIHGHTHRPAHHTHVVAGVSRERWVLTDWDAEAEPPRGGGLVLRGGRLEVLGLSQ